MKRLNMFRKEYAGRALVSICGMLMILITLSIGAFLIYKGSATFTVFGHSLSDFFFSADFNPSDSASGPAGTVGAAIFIVGSLLTCGLALLIAAPFSLAAAIFMSTISPRLGQTYLRPAIEIFVGIPSIVYGWTGLTVLSPFIRDLFHLPYGNTVFTASLVLALMIFPTITSVAADSLTAVPESYQQAAYALGSTRWQMIWRVMLPAAGPGIGTGIILGLTRAFGEALAVSMVIGKTRAFPKNIFSSTSTLTSVIASNMGNTFDGTEYNSALWTMALLLLLISLFFIILTHLLARQGGGGKHGPAKT
ncbi:MAG: phosphate ABC transporter permease subunit PstC [Oscillospiraceae bacterium]|nr:phosphate ABC transporter permease subunit PstC [Oscillospiraceae bacterium]